MHDIASGPLSARISDLGAELQSLQINGRELLWNGHPDHWTGRSPVLFPIVGRAADDHLTLDGSPITMAQHGFARRSHFTLDEVGPDFTRHLLTDSPETRARFPRAFALRLEHRLTPQGITISAEVTNRDTAPMPFQLGFHPAFLWPLPGAEGEAHSVTLANQAEPLRRPLTEGLVADRLLSSLFAKGHLTLDHALFAEDALIFPEGAGTALRYGSETGPALEFEVENLPSLALWTKPNAPFLCVEPWQGMAAKHGAGPAIEDRPGTLTLPPGASRRFTLRVKPVGF